MHDTTIFVQSRNNRIGNTVYAGRIEYDFIVLCHFPKEFINTGALSMPPPVLSIPEDERKASQ
jgi:hypothetical protein